MLVFGSSAIPKEIRDSGKYVPHCVSLGSNTHWGPVILDIKPIFYIYYLDIIESNFPLADWVEQCLSRIVIVLNEQFDIIDPDELAEVMCILESHIYKVIYCWTSDKEICL